MVDKCPWNNDKMQRTIYHCFTTEVWISSEWVPHIAKRTQHNLETREKWQGIVFNILCGVRGEASVWMACVQKRPKVFVPDCSFVAFNKRRLLKKIASNKKYLWVVLLTDLPWSDFSESVLFVHPVHHRLQKNQDHISQTTKLFPDK